MSVFNNFDIAGSAMSAQSQRLNITASNMANADTIAGSKEDAYHARQPVFQTVMQQANSHAASVRMAGVVESKDPVIARHAPGHPMADEQGNIYTSNVNPVEEMVNMLSASRSYQSNVEVFNTSKQLALRTLQMGE